MAFGFHRPDRLIDTGYLKSHIHTYLRECFSAAKNPDGLIALLNENIEGDQDQDIIHAYLKRRGKTKSCYGGASGRHGFLAVYRLWQRKRNNASQKDMLEELFKQCGTKGTERYCYILFPILLKQLYPDKLRYEDGQTIFYVTQSFQTRY